MASPRLRRGEPWRGYALKAPPRRNTGALLAGCAPARPLVRLYRRSAAFLSTMLTACLGARTGRARVARARLMQPARL